MTAVWRVRLKASIGEILPERLVSSGRLRHHRLVRPIIKYCAWDNDEKLAILSLDLRGTDPQRIRDGRPDGRVWLM